MSIESLVRLERHGALARITLARPAAGNALNIQLCRDLRAAAEVCSASPDIRAVLLRAEGPAFCYGGDIAEFEAAGANRDVHLAGLAADLHAAQSMLRLIPAPLVVAVQGAAAGAGLSLAMMGDIVVAGASASFALAYTQIGLSADGGATYFLPRLIGLRRTQELAFTNRRLSAKEALDWGMLTSVSKDEELQADAWRIAEGLAAGPTAAYGAVKNLLSQSYGAGFSQQTAHEAEAISRLAGGGDAAEGIAAFKAKRAPSFGGAPMPRLGNETFA
jgi:2-(1,2-epoxy-1,2-dihydrophenyl)acetyl-CoA isomerase